MEEEEQRRKRKAPASTVPGAFVVDLCTCAFCKVPVVELLVWTWPQPWFGKLRGDQDAQRRDRSKPTACGHSYAHPISPLSLLAEFHISIIVLSMNSRSDVVAAASQQAAKLPDAVNCPQDWNHCSCSRQLCQLEPHLFLREDLELPAEPRLPSRTSGQSSYSSGDQFSLGRSKLKLGCACRSTDMPGMHPHPSALQLC